MKKNKKGLNLGVISQFRFKQGECANVLDFYIQRIKNLGPWKHNANCLIFVLQGNMSKELHCLV